MISGGGNYFYGNGASNIAAPFQAQIAVRNHIKLTC